MAKRPFARPIGCHVSAAGGFPKAIDRAAALGATALQIFTSNPRGFGANPIDPAEAAAFREGLASNGIFGIAHMPYLPNLASPDAASHRRSVGVLVRELARCKELGLAGLVVHLGSHLGKGEAIGRQRIGEALQEALAASPAGPGPGTVRILLENTARTKNSIGNDWEELADFIARAGGDERLGVCWDTCHALAAGHDLRDEAGVAKVVASLLKNLDTGRLASIHLNDSKVPFGGCADRHEHLGLGHIGEKGLRAVLAHPKLKKVPVILETPYDDGVREQKDDLALAKKWAGLSPSGATAGE